MVVKTKFMVTKYDWGSLISSPDRTHRGMKILNKIFRIVMLGGFLVVFTYMLKYFLKMIDYHFKNISYWSSKVEYLQKICHLENAVYICVNSNFAYIFRQLTIFG